MSHCAFIFTRHLTDEDVRLCLELLSAINVKITHLGKNDPPKRWAGDMEEVLAVILNGTDLTNSTFLRDSTARLHIGIDLYRDPRWDSDTLSFSGVATPRLIDIARKLAEGLPCYAAIVGVSGGGKDQDWHIVHLSPDCPPGLRSKIPNAGQDAALNWP
jgi:hypothetical protein